jgi:hypothetical protein
MEEPRRCIRLDALLRTMEREARERPYSALALALLAGYLAGGGFFSRFTRLMFRPAMGATLVLVVRDTMRAFVLPPRQRAGAA